MTQVSDQGSQLSASAVITAAAVNIAVVPPGFLAWNLGYAQCNTQLFGLLYRMQHAFAAGLLMPDNLGNA
jgi:hypothetical protein